MILIADSGSTKTHWCITDKTGNIKHIFTSGINPYHQTEEDIAAIICNELMPEILTNEIEQLFFYGAGCAFPEKKKLLHNILKKYFNPTHIEIESDLLAAARGLFGNQPGIACILGTGSNSCVYSGNEVISNVSPLGYILGDEGSGAVLGKRLISDCLKNQLPAGIKEKFLIQYNLTPEIILEQVYRKPFPNRFLAKHALFLLENLHYPEIAFIVRDEFERFIQRNIMQYSYKDYTVGFIGSVAYYFSDILKEVCGKNNIKIAAISQEPMDGLVNFHIRN